MSYDWESLIPIGVSVLLGGLIGFERELRGRAAGLRTMILVCLGSTLLVLVSTRIAAHAAPTTHYGYGADPARLASGIVTGIGFLGAGVVLKLGDMIRGITTAATIWFVAAIGIALGYESYDLAVAGTVAALAVLALFQFPERLIRNAAYRTLVVVAQFDEMEGVEEAVESRLGAERIRILDVRARSEGAQIIHLVFQLRTTRPLMAPRLVKALSAIRGVRSVDWT